MTHDEWEIQGLEQDMLDLLRESAQTGWAVNFSFLAEKLTPVDREDEARKQALIEATNAKLFETMARGQFNDLRGVKEFYEKLGVNNIELSEQILGTMKELNERVGMEMFTVGPSLFNGRTLDGLTGKEAQDRQDSRVLAHAGYSAEQIPGMLPKLQMFRSTILALRAGPYSDFYDGFYNYVFPLFSGEQQNRLVAFKNPPQLPPGRRG